MRKATVGFTYLSANDNGAGAHNALSVGVDGVVIDVGAGTVGGSVIAASLKLVSVCIVIPFCVIARYVWMQ